jgi:hypothetical protein
LAAAKGSARRRDRIERERSKDEFAATILDQDAIRAPSMSDLGWDRDLAAFRDRRLLHETQSTS